MLTQELMIGKCEDIETKNSCWVRELVKFGESIGLQGDQTSQS